jgi:serine/threonine protein kinase
LPTRKLVPSDKAISIAWQNIPNEGGGWANWDPNSKEDAKAYARLLAPGSPFLRVVGDQVSQLPGWQEGAMMSAQHVVEQPNLTTVYEVGEDRGLHFIAMEFVEGQTLSSVRAKLSVKDLLSIVAQVAEALAAAHQSGVVHRDIKPDNVMVRPDGCAVCGVGLVTGSHETDRHTQWPTGEHHLLLARDRQL